MVIRFSDNLYSNIDIAKPTKIYDNKLSLAFLFLYQNLVETIWKENEKALHPSRM